MVLEGKETSGGDGNLRRNSAFADLSADNSARFEAIVPMRNNFGSSFRFVIKGMRKSPLTYVTQRYTSGDGI